MASEQNGSKYVAPVVALLIFVLGGATALYAKVETNASKVQQLEGAIYEIRQDIKLILSRTKP